MTRRAVTLTLVLLTGWGARVYLRSPTLAPNPGPLASFPRSIGEWSGRDAALDPAVANATGADDYLNRVYAGPSRGFISLYVAYYRSQREGDAVHSPLNCLPGAGWQALVSERVRVGSTDAAPTINKVIVDKSGDRQLVLYWYQSLSRVTASEYWSKAYMVADGFRSGRSDIALVRVVVALEPGTTGSQGTTMASALGFADRLIPLVTRQLFRSPDMRTIGS
jgi:EpsI family protein